ncbi:hypothetical protein MC7420_3897 [Coleofasciculus chthonoplastes PCC 7420]|uniref:ATPase AAA-type core domain-containing protein n=1 Tax=Coleofasciculus chthonoplastes PCC 7420 TaxID=118168 RepID=B4VUM9_9CYAN|nr:AAA family ATPase [Coleofasciculus chthonoplastes]EDX74373.1 hypothetical protein MC7420_3897 [Coleofasciculus chthonoplastes PCC 7420]
MHLQRIRVPDFRVLKDVDITFEEDFVPRIFPLGSLNGGGKSTLLQLIFTLLHCSTDPERKPFLQNLLYGFELHEDSPKRNLATIELLKNNRTVSFDFFCCKNTYIQKQLQLRGNLISTNYYYFSNPSRIQLLDLTNIDIDTTEEKELEGILDIKIHSLLNPSQKIKLNTYNKFLEEWYYLRQEIKQHLTKTKEYMEAENLIYVSDYKASKKEENNQNFLLCNINGLDMAKISEAEFFLKDLSKKIFLAAPSTQVFTFINRESRNLLFKSKARADEDYYSQLKNARSKLVNLFTYDFLAVDILIQAFKDAFDLDREEVVETGEYGHYYQRLKNELNQMLFNKKINIDKDLNGVNFTLDRNGETIELSPEDLSHGELKRLSIYMWLKHHNIEDAIVLMDEIEIAFHPDWQYQIIQDLQEWAPNNQYILATHSYELCQALTPAHVKELEPKLIQQDPEN